MQNGQLLSEYSRLSERVVDALTGVKEAIKDMNESNILHSEAIKANTQAIKNIDQRWGKILFFLVAALAILAGAEKVIKLLGM